MGLHVSAREAARLAGKTERTIRAWVAGGKLAAQPAGPRVRRQGVGPTRWLVDVDDLVRMPGVRIDRARLAELELRASEASVSTSLVERVSRLERSVQELQSEIHALRHQADDADGR